MSSCRQLLSKHSADVAGADDANLHDFPLRGYSFGGRAKSFKVLRSATMPVSSILQALLILPATLQTSSLMLSPAPVRFTKTRRSSLGSRCRVTIPQPSSRL